MMSKFFNMLFSDNATSVELVFSASAKDFDFEIDIPRRISFLHLIKREITEVSLFVVSWICERMNV